MIPSNTPATSRFAIANEFVSSDFIALASHMNDCERSRGRLFFLRAAVESLHALVSPRIVTTGALFVICGLVLLALA
ncbi:MAG: hypothetical protein HHJ16_07620 [Polaromonas sp.]|uniref:hypothetical protein n=1 Tax=Polaromonas sp. TaxID=1869339 RepID=UPI001843A535|nr:hypothetical protein [Polaromonas sp.]NMM10124.1 hypothetical protein [Polaromonas sp.]